MREVCEECEECVWKFLLAVAFSCPSLPPRPRTLGRDMLFLLRRHHSLQIIRFCHEHGLVLLADEVYQTNIYTPEELPFVSFRRVLKRWGLRHGPRGDR
jgi:hypothetical protein